MPDADASTHAITQTSRTANHPTSSDSSVHEQYTLPGMVVTNRWFTVPLDHSKPGGETIQVFARELVATNRRNDDLPYLVFFQGGPGGASPRPEARGGWIDRALNDYRVLLLDQRGTGISTTVNYQTVTARGNAQQQADYLALFRADSIVADAELIRKQLIGNTKWAILGQSFGGFCVLTYMSVAQHALSAAFITGGIPSLTASADAVYEATYPRVEAKNREFFARYPHAQQVAVRVADYLTNHFVTLPNGQRLTVEQFQQLGNAFGATGGYEGLMDLLERAFVTVDGREELSYQFRHGVFTATTFHTSPIFSILHEAIYCQNSTENASSKWAAERVRGKFPQFDYQVGKPFLFTGEMIYPWMFDQFETLKPMKEAAEILAAKSDWPALYDVEVLRNNRVPTAAALYFHDMYVDLDIALNSAAQIPNLEVWVTSEYEHNGLRADGARILGRLIDLLPVVH